MNNKPSDYELMLMLQGKDESALSLIYDLYAPSLFGIIVNKVKDEKLAADILHKTFVRTWSECSQIDCSKGRIFTWLIALTYKTARQDYKINMASPIENTPLVFKTEPALPQLYPVYAR